MRRQWGTRVAFSVVDSVPLHPGDLPKRVVDQNRDASLSFVATVGMTSAMSLLLTWRGRRIPLEVTRNEKRPRELGRREIVTTIVSFGSSPTALGVNCVDSYQFGDADEFLSA